MKKIICSLLLVLAMLLTLTVAASAETIPVALSEDLQTLNYGGHTFSRVNAANLRYENYIEVTDIVIPEKLQGMIRSAEVYTNDSYVLMDLTVYFHDGATLDVSFLRDDLREEYETLTANDETPCFIETDIYAYNPSGLHTTVLEMKGEAATFDADDYLFSNYYYDVVVYGEHGFDAVRGAVFSSDGEYFYVDYVENGIYGQYLYDFTGEIKAWRITDEALISEMEITLGVDGEGVFANILCIAVLVFFFILVPMAIGGICIALAIKDRGHGQTAAIVTAVLSGCVVLTTILIFIINNGI